MSSISYCLKPLFFQIREIFVTKPSLQKTNKRNLNGGSRPCSRVWLELVKLSHYMAAVAQLKLRFHKKFHLVLYKNYLNTI